MPNGMQKKSLWQVIRYGLKFTLKHMPAIFAAFCFFAMANAITDGFILLVMNWFFDSVEGALKNQVALNHVYLMVASMGLVYVLASVMSGGRSMMFMALIDKVNGEISRTIHEKSFEHLKRTLISLARADWKAAKKTSLLELCINILSAAGYMAVVTMLIRALLMEEITIGAFVAVFTAMGMMYENLEYVVNDHFGAMMRDMGKAQNFFRYMEMPERVGADVQANYDEGIVAKNISFMYPGTQHLSISDVSLEIKAGETIAIVGANGAGKTTLVRLLLGLYMPNEGNVVANGMDTALVNEKSLFAGVSGVFQRFQKYELTLNENVRAGDFASVESIDSAMKLANVDIDINKFPNGTDTMLSRSFEGGIDLSGGEWQRVAIARGLYRKHNLIVLDEPTAAIDPLEESRIYRQFVDISQGKTAIIVTHRLGSTRIADRVVVMNNGQIAEIGTHNELMQHCGLYAEMFHAQAGWYDENSVKLDATEKM